MSLRQAANFAAMAHPVKVRTPCFSMKCTVLCDALQL